ncbi:isoprenylcysteine carboxylmethyltransferase family protein [bacterium]|nr:isoprenylcysteine carboxylmethyltransferase family protein [bacterium]
MKPPRLLTQGFVNHHRKMLFRLMVAGLVAYLALVPNPWKLPDNAILSAQFAGAILIFGGILGRVLATISIGGHKDSQIMQTELYSVCRNPLYFASFLMAAGVGMLSGRLDFLILVVAAYLAIFIPMMINEANYLRAQFPDFADYEARVPMFIPNFSLWQERPRIEISFRLVKRTLLDASLALLVVPVMILFRIFA